LSSRESEEPKHLAVGIENYKWDWVAGSADAMLRMDEGLVNTERITAKNIFSPS
jgi:hypothetical protein